MSILITGITGFVGSHMVDYLLSHTGHDIYGTKRWRSRDENIKHFSHSDSRVRFLEADLLDRGSLSEAISFSKPEIVYHFASQSFPGASFKIPVQTLETNVIGTTNLLDELRLARDKNHINPIIVSVSSSEVYGMPKEDEIPINENNPIRASNPYSISKVGHDLMSQYYQKAHGLKIIITRMFSHEGKRRGKEFAISSFAYQVACEELQTPPWRIKVGNLNSIRTYAHIDDAIEAYWLVVQKGKVGEIYNIGGNETCTVGDMLEKLIKISNLDRDKVNIIVDPERVRPTDITLQIPDCSKFEKISGWKRKKNIDDILFDLLTYWRERVRYES